MMFKLAQATKVNTWTITPPSRAIVNRINRIAEIEDVIQVAILPDVHLSNEYCVGTAVATQSRIFPHAIGADIGCGMATIPLRVSADRLRSPRVAKRMLLLLQALIPILRRRPNSSCHLPAELELRALSSSRLQKAARRTGKIQLGTLGRGNHFVELQADADDNLWALVHSGSRGMGQLITQFHLERTQHDLAMASFDADNPEGQAYLNDVRWAIQYARENRRRMLAIVFETFRQAWNLDVDVDEGQIIDTNHNHVARERIGNGKWAWVHRKGTQPAHRNKRCIIPGSMGTPTYLVSGRGNDDAINSCSHGAGRRMSRREAFQCLSVRDFRKQMKQIAFLDNRADTLLDESPQAYNDIHEVIRAQRPLVRSTQMLTPLLNIKG